ncbi:hypothetical protein DENIS_3832 [Desulfonema ishimotonii]|uniref:Cas12f1-like TNB domain-containing protein n=1 Tax=Desulfonema ishimotonii TaxID=45657 RepID=A0A401G0U2_9BACT|nr:hypothetical protein DENIS_3832 [Desulfonema ishimotonii]
MRIKRSCKTSLRFTSKKKRDALNEIQDEYTRLVNIFIEDFSDKELAKKDLGKEITNAPESWLSARMRQCAAREALGMCVSAKNKAGELKEEPVRPVHYGRKMTLSSQCVRVGKGKNSFDLWLVIHSVGKKIKLYIPLKKHRHFNFFSDWKMSSSLVIHREYVMFSFEKETGEKKAEGELVGIDVGINHLLALSDGSLSGSEVRPLIKNIERKKQGSEAYKKAKKTLSYYLHKTVKEQLDWNSLRLVVVEKLNGLKKGKKGRSKNFRKTLSNWNYRELLNIIQMRCEENRVSFRSVNPYKTSQTCPACSHTERGNRVKEEFKCLKCGYSEQADIVGSLNILTRFTTGRYGAGFKT